MEEEGRLLREHAFRVDLIAGDHPRDGGGREDAHAHLERGENAAHLVPAAGQELGGAGLGGVPGGQLPEQCLEPAGGVSARALGPAAQDLIHRR